MAAKLTDLQLIYGIAGAREKFEELCTHLLREEHPQVNRIRVVFGDGGIDGYKGKLTGPDGIEVFQTKFFSAGIGDSQKAQIRESFKTLRDSKTLKTNSWTLCLPIDLSVEETRWFETWAEKQTDSGISIEAPGSERYFDIGKV